MKCGYKLTKVNSKYRKCKIWQINAQYFKGDAKYTERNAKFYNGNAKTLERKQIFDKENENTET